MTESMCLDPVQLDLGTRNAVQVEVKCIQNEKHSDLGGNLSNGVGRHAVSTQGVGHSKHCRG